MAPTRLSLFLVSSSVRARCHCAQLTRLMWVKRGVTVLFALRAQCQAQVEPSDIKAEFTDMKGSLQGLHGLGGWRQGGGRLVRGASGYSHLPGSPGLWKWEGRVFLVRPVWAPKGVWPVLLCPSGGSPGLWSPCVMMQDLFRYCYLHMGDSSAKPHAPLTHVSPLCVVRAPLAVPLGARLSPPPPHCPGAGRLPGARCGRAQILYVTPLLTVPLVGGPTDLRPCRRMHGSAVSVHGRHAAVTTAPVTAATQPQLQQSHSWL